jgi:hypothetical protein
MAAASRTPGVHSSSCGSSTSACVKEPAKQVTQGAAHAGGATRYPRRASWQRRRPKPLSLQGFPPSEPHLLHLAHHGVGAGCAGLPFLAGGR